MVFRIVDHMQYTCNNQHMQFQFEFSEVVGNAG